MAKATHTNTTTLNKLKIQKNRLAVGLIVALALLVVMVYAFYARVESYRIPQESYRFQIGQRQELGNKLKLKHTKTSTTMQSRSFPLSTADSTPIYYADKDHVVLPETMVVCQTDKLLFGRYNYFSHIYIEDSKVWVQNGREKAMAEPGFLFDGNDLYFFLDETTITWGSKTVTVPPMSYVVVRYNQSVELYDRSTDICVIEPTENQSVNAQISGGYRINMSTDVMVDPENNQILLFNNPELLPDLL